MNILILILLAVAGIVLLVLELFLIPGFGFAGIGGGACLVGAVVFAYLQIGATAGHITFFASLVVTAIAIYAFWKSRAIEKMGLDTSIDDKVELADPGNKIKRLQKAAFKAELTGLIDKEDLNGEASSDEPEPAER